MEIEDKLHTLYFNCITELESIGIKVIGSKDVGKIDILVSKRNNKRYGACKQEDPDKSTMYVERIGRRKIIKYLKYNKHTIEISPWVMKLDDMIIKNTIMHEIIHCMPGCNNHGKTFKEYAKYINLKLGYDISRVGNKEKDFEKSNIDLKEEKTFNYRVTCKSCGYTFYRQRMNKNFTKKYRCGTCMGRFLVEKI